MTIDEPAAGETNARAAERLAAVQAENRRLRDLLSAAGRLAEFGRFAAKLNHELRQPLFAIKGLAQLLLDRREVDVDEVRDFARHIVEQSERLTTLVADLRHLSIPAAPAPRAVTELPAVIARVAALLGWRFHKGVTLRTELAPDLPVVAIAPAALEQILVNLLSNALDAVAGQAQPTIQIHARVVRAGPTTSEFADLIEIDVADNGPGVAPAARARLFEDFFTTKGAEVGTGLGLAVSRELARAVGGTLAHLDASANGTAAATTVFKLALPVATTASAGSDPR